MLRDVEKRYPKNEAAQLEYIADAFLGFYKAASIGFPADVRKKPHHQVIKKPCGGLMVFTRKSEDIVCNFIF